MSVVVHPRFAQNRLIYFTYNKPIDAQRASVYGTLRLHGVSKEVKLDVTLNALKRHPMPPFRRTAGFSATTTLNRMDFGIDAWKAVIGDTVELRIEAEAVRDRGGAEEEAPADTPLPEDATEPDEAEAPSVTSETEPVTAP